MTHVSPGSASPDTAGPKPMEYLMSPKAMFRLGLGLVVLAIAWFLKYSFDQGWIGDVAKVSMAAAAGLGMIVAGIQISPRRPGYGNSLQGVGGAVLYLTAFATHQRYDLTDTTGVFLMLIAISTAVIGMALRQNSEILAIAGVAGALGAPALIGGTMDVFPGDAGYYVAVLAVAAALYLRNRWWILFSLATAGTATLVGFEAIVGLLGGGGDPAELQVAIAGCWVIGWGASILGAHRHDDHRIIGEVIPIAATVMIPAGALVATLATWRLQPDTIAWTSISFGLAIAHLVAFAVIRTRKPDLAAIQFAPVSLSAAFGLVGSFDGAWIVLAVAVQAGVFIVVGARSRMAVMAAIGHIMAGLTGFGWVALVSMGADSSWNPEDLVSGLIIVVTLVVAWAIQDTTKTESALAPVYAGLTLPGTLVWTLAILSPLPGGAGFVTGAWALTGFALLVWGRVRDQGLVRNLGIGVVVLAVAKLLIVDTAAAGTVTRIILSGSIGLALLAAGYWMAGDDEESAGAEAESPSAPDSADRQHAHD